jgi:hypothetical protein
LSPNDTPCAFASLTHSNVSGGESLALGEEIGRRIAQHGGAALIIDYGDDHVHSSSLQA